MRPTPITLLFWFNIPQAILVVRCFVLRSLAPTHRLATACFSQYSLPRFPCSCSAAAGAGSRAYDTLSLLCRLVRYFVLVSVKTWSQYLMSGVLCLCRALNYTRVEAPCPIFGLVSRIPVRPFRCSDLWRYANSFHSSANLVACSDSGGRVHCIRMYVISRSRIYCFCIVSFSSVAFAVGLDLCSAGNRPSLCVYSIRPCSDFLNLYPCQG